MKKSSRQKVEVIDAVECGHCFDCRWVLDDPLHMPFSALDLDSLLEGDEIIRCSECNSVPGIDTQPKAKVRQQEVITH